MLSEYGKEGDEDSNTGDYETDDADSMYSGGRSDNEEFGEGGGMQQCRFTEYSVSSSVLPRNDGLALLDDRFEEVR